MAKDRGQMIFAVALTLSALLLGSVEVDCRRRSTRQVTFRVISNSSVPCEELTLTLTKENGGVPPRRIELNDEDKKQIMRMRDYDYIPTVMATSELEAASKVVDPLRGYRAGSSAGQGTSLLSGNKKRIPLLRSEVMASLRSRSATGEGSAKNPDGSPEILQMPYYVKPEAVGLNGTLPIRHVNDFVTWVDYCQNRSHPMGTYDGVSYLSMCTVCSTTTYAPSNIWPRFTYGAACHATDINCLYEEDASYGRCHSNQMPVTMLQKSETECVMVLESGEKVIAEDWVSITQMLGIGCECIVSEQSKFR